MFKNYAWRGHRRDDWVLKSTIARQFQKQGISAQGPQVQFEALSGHLENFKLAVRGRRGPNPPVLNEDEWWALGQHHGLDTPLLDWTESPFVALYFAFYKEGPDPTDNRVIYAIHADATEWLSQVYQEKFPNLPLFDRCRFIRPRMDDNPRLVNQAGLFSYSPLNDTVSDWIIRLVPHAEDRGTGYLVIKVIIPDNDREGCLQTLNRMNINHSTLFPDLYGAAQYCNMRARIREY